MSLLILFLLTLFLFLGKPKMVYHLPTAGACLTHNRTNVINAFFIIIILLRHIDQRLVPFCGIDVYYDRFFNSPAAQGIVSTFFFFSGYGIMQSIRKKKELYVRDLMSKRFLRLYFNTAVCCLFCCFVYGCTFFEPYDAALSFVKTMVGAGGYWFIIMTLAIYVTTWVGFKFCGVSRPVIAVFVSAALTYALCLALIPVKPMWWLDTELCFPCGMLLAIYLTRIEGIIRKLRLPILLVGCAFFLLGWQMMKYHMIGYNLILRTHLLDFLENPSAHLFTDMYHILVYPLCTVVWVLGILWIFASVKWQKESAFLVWLGGPAVFYIYVLHFVPIRLIQYFGTDGDFPLGLISEAFGWGALYPKAVVLATVVLSLVLAFLMQLVLTKLDAPIFERKKLK